MANDRCYALTNFSPEGKTANAWDIQEFFSGEDFDLTLESQRVAQKLSEIELAPQQYDIPRLFQVQEGLDPIKLRGLHRKVSTMKIIKTLVIDQQML